MANLSFLGTRLPIIQAPMAGVQGSALALAVSNAGGLGSLPCAMLSLEALRTEIDTLRAGTPYPYQLNFFCHTPPAEDGPTLARWQQALAPLYEHAGVAQGPAAGASRQPFSAAIADLLEAAPPPWISFHFGLPGPALMQRIRGWGTRVLSSATTVPEALWLAERGVDAVIAQGLEAGGHRGHFLSDDLSLQMGTFALLPQLVAALDIPVVAAGGIADAQGIRAALALGASAVQLGTSFLLCTEATTSAVHRQALQGPQARHTALTTIFSGRPARGIVNRAMRELGCMPPETPPFPLASAAWGALRSASEAQGSGDFSPLWSGQNNTGCRPVPAGRLLQELATGCSR